MATTSLSPTDLAATIHAAWAASLARARHAPIPHAYVYASAWRICARRMVYEMTMPEAAPPWPVETLAKFRRGDDRERDLLADLARIGRDAEPSFDVIAQQERFTLRDRKGRDAIVGKVDARLAFGHTLAPVEVKAWSPYLTEAIDTFDDVFKNQWTRAGGYQLLAYLYGAAEPFGFLLLDRSGLPLLLPVELDHHLDRMDDFLSRAEYALDHQRAGTLPAFLDGQPAECQRCPFYGGTCNPPLSSAGAAVLTDPDLEAQLERREALKAAGVEYAALDRAVKAQLRGVERGIAGSFAISGTWGATSRVDLPPDVKAQYTVSDPRGRFTLEIARL